MAALDDTLAATAKLASTRDAALTTAVVQQQATSKDKLLALPSGTRVLDLVTGHEGVVIDGQRRNVVIPRS